LFPGVGLFDRAFEGEGWCVVRGPDLMFGSDVRTFHAPAAKFDGVIGGPPCKGDSQLAHLNGEPGVDLRGEFARVVREAAPAWWVMEAVKPHMPELDGDIFETRLTPRWLGSEQSRLRFFYSNLDLARWIQPEALEPFRYAYAVRAANRTSAKGTTHKSMASYKWPEMLRLQGLPLDFALPAFTMRGKEEAVGNGVPLPMGRAIARAVWLSTAERWAREERLTRESEKV